MKKWSPRTWVLGGFGISLSSVVLNTLVLSQLNQKLAAVNSEQTSLKESLSRMATEMQRAENKYELVRMFHWVAMQAPKEHREQARTEAAYVLVNYFTRTYAAVHDIPPVEVIRTEMVEREDDYAVMKKLSDLVSQLQKAQKAGDLKAVERIEAEVDKVDADACEVPRTELGKKFAELTPMGYAEANADTESDLLLVIAPTLQSLRDEFIKTHESKTQRIKELDLKKARLVNIQSITSYLAIGLQLLGLFFILSRDIVKDINDKKKAEEAKALAKS